MRPNTLIFETEPLSIIFEKKPRNTDNRISENEKDSQI